MCGIVGTYRSGLSIDRMLAAIAHRGPDGRGTACPSPDVVVGHARLSIRDLSLASAQPLRYGAVTLSYNGELWNETEVRLALAATGRWLSTTGDTEVVAAALDAWGVGALPRLDGMFALSWVGADGLPMLARDRFGKVPLYAARLPGGGAAWASERKALGAVGLRCLPVPPGSVVDLERGSVARWYALSGNTCGADALTDRIERAVERRMVSDAPLCALVSGGLDSMVVASLARRSRPDLVAYTAVMDPASPDLFAARRACLEMELPLVEVAVQQPTAQTLAEAVRVIEIGSKAQVEIAALCIPLASAIASDGFKVCLSGEGADELFGGYGNMCIRGSRADDEGWREIRRAAWAKMSRGNFVRCNKAFMAYGVECRLPWADRAVVEGTLSMSKAENPPGKALLKRLAVERGWVPGWVARRQKETFQGASGSSAGAAAAVASPARFYAAECLRLYGVRGD